MATPNFIHTMRRFIAISRPVFYITAVAVFVVGLLAGGGPLLTIGSLVGALCVTFPMGLVVYGINDIADRESDAKNPRKGGMDGALLTQAEIRPLIVAIIITIIVSLLICVLLDRIGMGLALLSIYVLVGYMYSVKPIRLKNRPVFDSLTNGFWAVSVFMAGYWANTQGLFLQLPPHKALIAILLFGAALHALGAVQDYEVDKAMGDTTICVALGKTNTLLLCTLVFLACVPLMHAPGIAMSLYVLAAAGLTASALRYQSARYVRIIFFTIVLLLPIALMARQLFEQ